MIHISNKTKIEYGDFQTPIELTHKICEKLIELRVNPDVILEPTCGIGNFIDATLALFPTATKIIGVELNRNYLDKLRTEKKFRQDHRLEFHHGDFFKFDWSSLINSLDGNILILGNFPWVTNSRQGKMNGTNLPRKTNFQDHTGLDAITGKSNFDISEWMLIQAIQWIQGRNGYLAMLCKTSVARKLLSYLYLKNLYLADCAIYNLDAKMTKTYFNATVEACLFFCKFDSTSRQYACNVFSSFNTSEYHQIGYRNTVLIKDLMTFDKLSQLYDTNPPKRWRSGIKHDCSNIMEFYKNENYLMNGLGERVELEETYLFPLLKGSDVAQGRTQSIDKYVLVTQRFIGESTDFIRDSCPKTWKYLESHASYLDHRKSKIYENNPRYSIFGVGEYTFKPWKIAICGLYKKLDFKLIGTIADKPVIFDDTVYFLSFEDEKTAHKTFMLLTSQTAISFYSSLIFWDEKRPIKSKILNSLDLEILETLDT